VADAPNALKLTDTDHSTLPGVRWWQYDWLRQSVNSGLWASLAAGERSVLVAILVHANAEGEAWPSVETICRESGLKRRAVQACLASLLDCRRAVTRHRPGFRDRTTATYTFTWSDWAVPPSRTKLRIGAHSHAQGVHLRALGGAAGCAQTGKRNGEENVVGGGARAFEDDGADQKAVIDLLLERGFTARKDAQAIVSRYGPARCREGVHHADFVSAKDGVRKSYVHLFVEWVKSGRGVDARLVAARKQAEAKLKAAAEKELREAAERVQREEADAARRADDQLWASIAEASRQAHRSAVLESLDKRSRDVQSRCGPDHPYMRQAILKRVREGLLA
jgi:hypothetical protein